MHKGEHVLIVFNVNPGETVNWAGYKLSNSKVIVSGEYTSDKN